MEAEAQYTNDNVQNMYMTVNVVNINNTATTAKLID